MLGDVARVRHEMPPQPTGSNESSLDIDERERAGLQTRLASLLAPTGDRSFAGSFPIIRIGLPAPQSELWKELRSTRERPLPSRSRNPAGVWST